MDSFRYGVVGAGRQGVATAYDMVARGGGASVLVMDRDADVAQRAAERINRRWAGQPRRDARWMPATAMPWSRRSPG